MCSLCNQLNKLEQKHNIKTKLPINLNILFLCFITVFRRGRKEKREKRRTTLGTRQRARPPRHSAPPRCTARPTGTLAPASRSLLPQGIHPSGGSIKGVHCRHGSFCGVQPSGCSLGDVRPIGGFLGIVHPNSWGRLSER